MEVVVGPHLNSSLVIITLYIIKIALKFNGLQQGRLCLPPRQRPPLEINLKLCYNKTDKVNYDYKGREVLKTTFTTK